MKMLGMVRTVMLIVFCVLVLGEESTIGQLISYTISLAAFGAYVMLPQLIAHYERLKSRYIQNRKQPQLIEENVGAKV